jgi:hypothetical protein
MLPTEYYLSSCEGRGSSQTARKRRLATGTDQGRHRQFKHPTKPGTVTVSGKSGLDMSPGTLNSVLKQAELK